jgi:hypothetical protein
MFGFVKKAFDKTIGGVVNQLGKAAGGVLEKLHLERVLGPLAEKLGAIPGFNRLFGGVLQMVPKLLRGKLDLLDAVRLGAIFLPPPVSAIARLADLATVTNAVVDRVGPLDPGSPGATNVLHLAQKIAFELAARELEIL